MEVSELESARTVLFVPGDRPERFDTAARCGADLVVVDLEDDVAPGGKQAARAHVVQWLSRGGRAVVRVNGRGTPWFTADVEAVTAGAARAGAVMLPKCGAAADVEAVVSAAPGTAVIALVESAAGVGDIREICAAPGVARVAFGHIDFCAEVGLDPSSHAGLLAARSALVYASAEAGLPSPVDGVTTAVGDDEALTEDCRRSKELGFGAKLCIHPRQVETVARVLAPSGAELAWARTTVEAASAGGVVVIDGHMVDAPVLARARRLLRAGLSG